MLGCLNTFIFISCKHFEFHLFFLWSITACNSTMVSHNTCQNPEPCIVTSVTFSKLPSKKVKVSLCVFLIKVLQHLFFPSALKIIIIKKTLILFKLYESFVSWQKEPHTSCSSSYLHGRKIQKTNKNDLRKHKYKINILGFVCMKETLLLENVFL